MLPCFQKTESKVMINISSEVRSIENCRRSCEYSCCMSKAAQNMATKILSNAFQDIKFYAIHPRWMKSEQGYAGGSKPPQDPKDSVNMMVRLAEERRDDIYYDISGNSMPW